MNVTEFFQQSVGKWFSQRTHHQPSAQTPESGRSDVYIDWLENDAPDVVQLCDRHQVNPQEAIGGMQVRWEGSMGASPDKKTGTTLVVAIANADDPTQGKILQQNPNLDSTAVSGRYMLGDDEALTLITEMNGISAEERIWFASDNLRLRTRVLKTADGVSDASFYSEIRMGGVRK
ncbi:phycobiliprotein lyase [Vacuolonema iberomarrocanum]|uniref:phycobiliprotein lyase n=1 Tax=Vacuolonema iberomarrocanum TaxID=3454632 RepID=UPI001A106214|nr:phycobiliprotein lyase [filamentous cyanobacterium LEGE 07170]